MISKDILDKMDHARRFLAAPAPEVVGDLIAEIRILTAQRDEAVNNYETAQLLSIRVGEQRDTLAHSADWNRRRVEMLSMLQKHMRDPERTLVCDILANGQLLPDPKGKRYGFATTGDDHNSQDANKPSNP